MSCVDLGPFACLEEGCSAASLSCYALANRMHACERRFSELWETVPDGVEPHAKVSSVCPFSCSTCTGAMLRATVYAAEPGVWPTTPLEAERAPANATDEWLAARIANAFEAGPLIIPDAMGTRFRPVAWTRSALHKRCAAPAGVPPSPPWPTIAYRQPSAVGKSWAGMRFENGAALGVRDLPSLLDAQDEGRLRGVALFDSPANHTCPNTLERSSSSLHADGDALPAPRFFPTDFEVALGGPAGEGLWRKGGSPWDDPDVFASKAGTRTHVHIDSHCTRFWMLMLSGRKLWRVMPPSEGEHLAPAARGDGAGEHFEADVLEPRAERNADVGASLSEVRRLYEFVLQPGELVLIPERWAHAVHNLDDTIAMTYNFVDEANLGCYVREGLRPKAGKLLKKLFGQLVQGRGRADAARAFGQHSNLAYYAHLVGRLAARAGAKPRPANSVASRVAAEHPTWEAFFSSQGPYAAGGDAAVQAEIEIGISRLLGYLDDGPPPAEAAMEQESALLDRFEAGIAKAVAAERNAPAGHDEL